MDSTLKDLDVRSQRLHAIEHLLGLGDVHGIGKALISVVSPLVVVAVTVQPFVAVAVCVYTTLWPLVTS